MYSDILDQVTTKPELDALLGEIDIYRDNMYRLGKESAREVLVKYKDELDKLRQAALDLPVVRLTLALELPGSWMLEVTNWVIRAVGKAVVLDMAVDKQILGGAIVSYKGKYGDFSLRKKLDNFKFSNTNLQINS